VPDLTFAGNDHACSTAAPRLIADIDAASWGLCPLALSADDFATKL